MSLLDCVCCPRHGHLTAVVWDDLQSPSFLTYSYLVKNSCRLACYLRQRVPWLLSGWTVGLYGSSCPEMLCALLGILAVPAAYVPVDLSQPAAMKERTLEQLGVGCIVVHTAWLEDFLAQEWPSCCVQLDTQMLELGLVVAFMDWKASPSTMQQESCDNLDKSNCCTDITMCNRCSKICQEISQASTREEEVKLLNTYAMEVRVSCELCEHDVASVSYPSWPFPKVKPTLPAYILHTSGTMGEPKAITVPHCCIVPNVVDLRERFRVNGHRDVVFNAAPLTFDPSVVEIFLALSSGGTLLVVPEKVKRSPPQLAAVLFRRQYATVLQTTPSLVRRFSERDIRCGLLGTDSNLRVLAFGGESCPKLELLADWKHSQNSTTLFNIYGATEVSSWQTCYQITPEDLRSAKRGFSLSGEVPIGDPLLGTAVEVRDGDGVTIGQGRGEVWIGGQYRVCMLQGEQELLPGCMRPSGDIGYIGDDGRLYCVGRTDRQIKRSGHRINLDSIQQIISALEGVSGCAATTLLRSQLRDSPLVHWLSTPTHALHGTDTDVVAFIVPSVITRAGSRLTRTLASQIWQVLPSYSLPDVLVLVRELPTTKHGKVDLKSLINCTYPDIYLPVDTTTVASHSTSTMASQHLMARDVTELLLSVTSDLLGLNTWPDQSCILELGVNSFNVVRLANQFEIELRKKAGNALELPQLVDQLLSRNLREVSSYIYNQMSSCPDNAGDITGGGHISEEAADTPSWDARKRLRSELQVQDVAPPAKMFRACSPDKVQHWSAWRRGQYFEDGQLRFPSQETDVPCSTLKCSFKTKWSVDTQSCVDASPLVVQRRGGPLVVYVGSHSGQFFATELLSGAVLWKTQLSDRVESSACVSLCCQYVIVGCYDGCVYALCADSGEVHSCYRSSQEPVKSSPCVDPATGFIWFGSHDHHLYAISLQDKSVVHRVFPGGGSCFSSPCINSITGVLHCATLEGSVVAVDLRMSAVKWVYACPKPVFSSPALLPSGKVAVGCVNGGVYLIGGDGELVGSVAVQQGFIQVGEASTDQPVFSSCCVVECDGLPHVRVYSGSHDKCIYCWNEQLGLEWKTELDSEVYSTPGHCNIQIRNDSSKDTLQDRVPCICACSTGGYVYILSAGCGRVLGSLRLPCDIFSSPVVVDNHIVVGCRDNDVYCIEINISES